MLFNSVNFLVFFAIVFFLYWNFQKEVKYQNILLFLSSYLFYSFWDWRFLFMLFFSTFLDFSLGIKLQNTDNLKKRKIILFIGIFVNLSILCLFKYFDFFSTSIGDFLNQIGFNINSHTLNLIIPVGISFYTFHGVSYLIDIYNQRTNAEKSFINYAVFVSFFPLLIAGPIERATHLLPQIQKKRNFNYNQGVDGLRQILWGLFKKVVIADNCSPLVDEIFTNSSNYNGSILFIGAVLFAFQIYGDFSGYTDIALGLARLLGFELMQNFSFPYFSRDIAEFWRRWHISLSSWFRDYVYIPLGGSRGNKIKVIRNVFVIFILSGFWHGANWTFIFWGFLNALYFIPILLIKRNRKNLDIVALDSNFPSPYELFSIFYTFFLTCIAWVFFRSNTIFQAFGFIKKIFLESLDFSSYKLTFGYLRYQIGFITVLYLIIFIIVEWRGRRGKFALSEYHKFNSRFLRFVFYLFLIFSITFFSGNEHQFIYFQF
jgi:alginate O-acetyltransferase complex protein AlgI